MSRPRRTLPAALAVAAFAVALVAGACGVSAPRASSGRGPSAPLPTPSAIVATGGPTLEQRVWPTDGSSACDRKGYGGRMGSIRAVDSHTILFSLCRPDGAFLARLADPAMAIQDRAALARLATDPGFARQLPGTGPYRIARWQVGEEVVFERNDSSAGSRTMPEDVVVAWDAAASDRLAAIRAKTADAMDGPATSDRTAIESDLELRLVPRPQPATLYLGFNAARWPFDERDVRLAFAGGIDRQAIVDRFFPAGSTVASHLTPCFVPQGCAGADWYEYDPIAAKETLQAAGFDFTATYPIHFDPTPTDKLPDPAGIAEAIRAQLADRLGVRAVLDPRAPADYAAELAGGKLLGMHLAGISARVPDPIAFLSPLVGPAAGPGLGPRSTELGRLILDAGRLSDGERRTAAIGKANDALRRSAPLVPIAQPASAAVFRADVVGAHTSFLGLEALGRLTPGERRQVVWIQAGEPSGAYCAATDSLDAFRICGLVSEGLYGYAPGGSVPEPRLAHDCSANADATVWTCTLREGVRFHDAARLDSADVVASFAAQWDPAHPAHAAVGDTGTPGWTALFGSLLPVPEP